MDAGKDTGTERCHHKDRKKPTEGLFIGKDTWREMFDFSENAVLLSLASAEYDESDYIRDYGAFLKYLEEKNK